MPTPTVSNTGRTGVTGTGTTRVKSAADIQSKLNSMTIAEKAKLLLMNYGDTNVAPWSGSVIVNQTHLTSVGVPKLKNVVNRAADRNGVTVLVGADQEGGAVNRMRKVPGYAGVKFPSPAEMARMTPEQLKAEGAKVGKALRAAGVNTLLGPVLDAADVGTLMNRQGRAFGSTPEAVLKAAQPFLDGLKAENPNVVVMAKHFPGYNVRGNSDLMHVSDPSTLAQVEARASSFFNAKGVDGIMMSSVRFPNIDNEPACFSTAIISMLRKHDPDALVITDDIAAPGLLSDKACAFKNWERAATGADPASKAEAAGYLKKYPDFATPAGKTAMRQQVKDEIKENAKKAFLAGCDVVLTMDSSVAPQIAQAITELVQSRPDLKLRLDAAALRMMEASIKATPGAQPVPVTPAAPTVVATNGWQPK